MTYRFRRWLFRKLMPKRLSIHVFEGCETLKGNCMYDPDHPNTPGWGFIHFERWAGVYSITVYESIDGTETVLSEKGDKDKLKEI